MDKQQLTEKTVEVLRPFETANLIDSIQNLTLHQIFTNPVILLIIAVVFFFGIIKRSKPLLLGLFSMLCLIVIVRFAMPAPGDALSFKSTIPFVGGGLLIGGVVIYFTLVKSD